MALTTGDGLPLAATVHSASPGEVTLIEGLLEQRVLKRKLPRLIYDEPPTAIRCECGSPSRAPN